MQARIYDLNTFREGVEHGVFYDVDGFGEGLIAGHVVDDYIVPSDIDVIRNDIEHIRWFGT